MVSSVHEMGSSDWKQQKKWWDDIQKNPYDPHPMIPTIPIPPTPPLPWIQTPLKPILDLDLLRQWKKAIDEMIRVAEEYDKATNQPNCEDPKKMEWMKEVEKRLAELEAAKNAKG
jgi:hypothetical protein